MSQHVHEEILRYGEQQRGYGILSQPEQVTDTPVLVIFNAGLLHRTEPYRLNVIVARTLAGMGIRTVRVDLAGKGDTPVREGLKNRESVAQDWIGIRQSIKDRFGADTKMILMGLCSGADNAIKLSVDDPDVVGLVLIDPESPIDSSFGQRRIIRKLSDPAFLFALPVKILKRLLSLLKRPEGGSEEPPITLRDPPRPEDLEASMRQLVQKNGRIFAVFTSFANEYYNLEGQFVLANNIEGLGDICQEHMWFDATHILPVSEHRERFLQALKDWFRDEILKA